MYSTSLHIVCLIRFHLILTHWPLGNFNEILDTCTVETPYNTNVGVQKNPDRAIWKPVVAKRNNTNP